MQEMYKAQDQPERAADTDYCTGSILAGSCNRFVLPERSSLSDSRGLLLKVPGSKPTNQPYLKRDNQSTQSCVRETWDSGKGAVGQRYDSAEFAKFARDWQFKHVTSSPHFPQSNGQAERAVQTAKELLKKAEGPARALLAYRSTPLELTPKWHDLDKIRERTMDQKAKQKVYHDIPTRARDLQTLSKGQPVWITDKKLEATVKDQATAPRSYVLDTPKGTLCCNRLALINLKEQRPDYQVKMESTNQSTTSTDTGSRTRFGGLIKQPKKLDL